MSDYPIHTTQTAPEGSQEHLAGLEQNIGFIPNLAGTIGGSPTAIQASSRCSPACAARG